MILAIDPGNEKSAYVVIDDTLKPVDFGKLDNQILLNHILLGKFKDCDNVAIEMVASYGMPVGKEVFDTCVWIGRFTEAMISEYGKLAQYIYRKDVKMAICGNTRAKDANIRQALIDRFGPVGTIKNKGWFYGFKADLWQAYALAVTYNERRN
jgi:hypothetical protein